MDFRIADTFTDSLTRLTGDEQKAVKTTAFDLQIKRDTPGKKFHKLDRAKDKNFCSVRVSRDLRIIVHKTKTSLLLCYVDHHDRAYDWAEQRKLETHPKTGAAQLVEIRERVQEIPVPKYVEVEQPDLPKPPLYEHLSDDELLDCGLPVEWLADVRKANEDSILELAAHLPDEAAEALLNLATGVAPPVLPLVAANTDPFDHPDAQRRFRVMSNVEELERAFENPWSFLHPSQRQLVEREELCSRLHEILHRLKQHSFPPPDYGIPDNGLYFLFEAAEPGHVGERIVRIGSHTGDGNLRARLKEHVTPNKDRSIFRKNLGRALLNRDGDPFFKTWDFDLTSRKNRERYGTFVDKERQGQVENSVSEHITRNLSFCTIAVPNREVCLEFERRGIATVSLCRSCCPSPGWLGSFSPKTRIRESGLWQEQHLYKEPLSLPDLRTLEDFAPGRP